MTKLLEQAIAKLKILSPDRQDEAAELLLSVVERDNRSLELTDDQAAEVQRRLAEPADHATHADVRAFFQTRGA